MTERYMQYSLFEEMDPMQESTDWKWSFKDYPKEKNGLKVFSCFACGGGSTMGYKLAGCEVLGCVEIDPRMNEIYVKNHHPKYNYCMDLREFNNIPNNELPEELFHLDILDGSPPCTTFSMAGQREESWGKQKKFREGQKEQTLDDLSFVFIDTVAKLRPKVVIMENVEGLMLGEALGYVQRIYKELSNAGYLTKHWLLKGERMGIPQTRHRVFFVSCRSDLLIDPSEIDMYFNYAPVLFGEVKEGTGQKINTETEAWKWLSQSLPSDKRLADAVVRAGVKEKLFNNKILQDHYVAQTVGAAADFYRGKEKTLVSYEDLRNIQTFPVDYDFGNVSVRNVKYICGMSVPPVMMKRVVTRLIDQGVFNYKKEEQNNV